MKNPKNLTKLKILDFDSTLVRSPHDTTLVEGVPARQRYDNWLVETGQPPRKWLGWWGRKETLLPPIFGEWQNGKLMPPPDCLNVALAEQTKEYFDQEDCLVVLMTGRHMKMTHNYNGVKEHVCKSILDEYGLKFDRYYYGSTGQPTITFKLNVIQSCLREFPRMLDIEIWEDRHPHTSEFWNFVKYYKKIGKLDEGLVHQVDEFNFGDMPEDTG